MRLPETAGALAHLSQSQSIRNGLVQVPYGCCVGGKNSIYEGLHSGYGLKKRCPAQQIPSNQCETGDLLSLQWGVKESDCNISPVL